MPGFYFSLPPAFTLWSLTFSTTVYSSVRECPQGFPQGTATHLDDFLGTCIPPVLYFPRAGRLPLWILSTLFFLLSDFQSIYTVSPKIPIFLFFNFHSRNVCPPLITFTIPRSGFQSALVTFFTQPGRKVKTSRACRLWLLSSWLREISALYTFQLQVRVHHNDCLYSRVRELGTMMFPIRVWGSEAVKSRYSVTLLQCRCFSLVMSEWPVKAKGRGRMIVKWTLVGAFNFLGMGVVPD